MLPPFWGRLITPLRNLRLLQRFALQTYVVPLPKRTPLAFLLEKPYGFFHRLGKAKENRLRAKTLEINGLAVDRSIVNLKVAGMDDPSDGSIDAERI